jgi:16S rRNA (adenine1518-N6/adenine1519-N6)-dimethyltransferase
MKAMLQAKKRLGQNFLVSEQIAKKIAALLSPVAGDLIFEIGPGRGALTIPLARSGAAVVAYEIDESLVDFLLDKFETHCNVEIYHADVRTVNFDAASDERGRPSYKIAGNIPFNLTSTILIDLARWRMLDSAVLMVQREVGERIVARPGERNCGILSIFLQSYFIIERVLKVRPGSFAPPPRVDSVVLRFVPNATGIGPKDREAFLQFLKGCFSHRRKKLRNVRGEILGANTAKDWNRLSELAGVDFDMRPEELTLEGWFGLFAASRRLRGLR